MSSIRDALALPWGAERNLAMRAALGLVEGEICLVNQGDYIQAVVAEHRRANEVARALKMALGSAHDVRVTARPDRRYVVHSTPENAGDPLTLAREILRG